MKRIQIVLMTVLLCSFALSSLAYALDLSVILGKKEEEVIEVPPAETPEGDLPDWLDYEGYEVKSLSGIDRADRSEAAVAEWVQDRVTEVLSFDAPGFKDHQEKLQDYFTPGAQKQFMAYLKAQDIMNAVLANGFETQTIIEFDACVTKSKEFKGVYRWLAEVPFSVSFVNPRQRAQGALTTTRGVARLQIRRVEDGGIDGLKMEKFLVRDITQEREQFCLN